MAAYRVTALYYRFASETDHHDFGQAAPLAGELGPFSVTLANGILEAIPSEEFRDRQAARNALEPSLRDWEQAAFLSDCAYRVRFEYERSAVEEIDPQPGVVNIFGEVHAHGSGQARLTVAPRRLGYPPLDRGFVRTPLTDLLTARLRRTRDGGETWPAFAYFVLTQLQAEFGGAAGSRSFAAKTLSVSRAVVERLGSISSKRDPSIGRKAGRTPEEITPAERAWLEAVVVRLIRRVGEHAGGGPLPLITMADFPPLV
jgi:hypothetical protein